MDVGFPVTPGLDASVGMGTFNLLPESPRIS